MYKSRLAVILGTFLMLPLLTCGVAAASYNGSSATSYANTWALSTNTNYNSFPSDDCTNFVTQAMAAGGFPFVRGIYTNIAYFYNDTIAVYDNNPTYQKEDGREESLTATVADDLAEYFSDTGTATVEGDYSYAADGNAPSYMPASIKTGDVLFYDWGQGAGISHDSMMVGSGTDSDGYVGDWVDQHTNPRYHEFWTLKETNPYWETTTVYYFHLNG